MKHIFIQHPGHEDYVNYCWKCGEAKEHGSHYVIEFPTNPLVRLNGEING